MTQASTVTEKVTYGSKAKPRAQVNRSMFGIHIAAPFDETAKVNGHKE
jgi:hypothetical protein